MKLKGYAIQIGAAALLSAALVAYRIGELPATAEGRLRVFCDAFFIVGMLYFCIGALIWVSTTGFFDIFSYAFRKGAHALIPGRVSDTVGGFYEYKLGKQEKRSKKGSGAGGRSGKASTLLIGILLLAVSAVLTALWYGI